IHRKVRAVVSDNSLIYVTRSSILNVSRIVKRYRKGAKFVLGYDAKAQPGVWSGSLFRTLNIWGLAGNIGLINLHRTIGKTCWIPFRYIGQGAIRVEFQREHVVRRSRRAVTLIKSRFGACTTDESCPVKAVRIAITVIQHKRDVLTV